MGDTPNVLQFVRLGGVVSALFIFAVGWMVAAILRRTVDRLGERFTDNRMRLQQAGTLGRFLVYLVSIVLAVLASFELSEQTWLALGGTAAVTIGFALKDLAASVLAGVTILIDRPFQVGDRVSFGGYYGEISTIGLRSVRLVTLDDNLVTIPNNKFLTDVVSCGNAGALDMMVQMDFLIGLDQDIELARQIVGDALTTTRYGFLNKPWSVSVSLVNDQSYLAVRLRAKVYVLDVRFEKALETDVTMRVLAGLRAAGVQPPVVREVSLRPAEAAGAAPVLA
jgi:small-conductance mechanosensitive channel